MCLPTLLDGCCNPAAYLCILRAGIPHATEQIVVWSTSLSHRCQQDLEDNVSALHKTEAPIGRVMHVLPTPTFHAFLVTSACRGVQAPVAAHICGTLRQHDAERSQVTLYFHFLTWGWGLKEQHFRKHTCQGVETPVAAQNRSILRQHDAERSQLLYIIFFTWVGVLGNRNI